MIKRSKEEKNLEKEVRGLEEKKEELKTKTRSLKKMQYSRRLKKVLRKMMGFSPRYEDNDKFSSNEFNAFLDQLVEKIFVLFPNLEMSAKYVDCEVCLCPRRYCTDFGHCLDWSFLRMDIFEDEKPGQGNMLRRSEKKRELLLERQLPVEELTKIVFMAVILNAAKEALPIKWSTGNILDGGGIH